MSERPEEAPHRRRRAAGCLLVVLALLVGGLAAAWVTRTQPLLSDRCTATVGDQTHRLAPDQARNAALITAVAEQRGMPARAASIGIATAIQESKLRNIDYGDRDSIGLFQQRPSQGWGTIEQIMDPIYSTNAFYDALEKIDGYESMVITEVAQKVQRSAFPDAYGFHEPQARAFASGLSGHSPGAIDCRLKKLTMDAEAAGANGFTPRAEAVRGALATEFGTNAVTVGAEPTEVIVTATDARRAWGVASWAVASADDLAVVFVEVDGQRWQRGESGWADVDAAKERGNADDPGANIVRIGVA